MLSIYLLYRIIYINNNIYIYYLYIYILLICVEYVYMELFDRNRINQQTIVMNSIQMFINMKTNSLFNK